MKCLSLPRELSVGFHTANAFLTDTGDITVRFQKADCLTLSLQEDTVVIGYSHKAEALRGMSMAKRFRENPVPVSQRAKFDTLTLMADCSRNSVLKPESVKELMVTLAMMGFTSMMLYTEDTYEIPGHPYFGHMRGRYSVQELKDLNAYGQEVGVELIPCIQTLAHLNAIFNWPVYSDVRDIDDILLAGSERTYALVEDMLKTCRECFTSSYINIGMDEAHHLGRGVYTDKNGFRSKPEIMLRHLDRVVELCKKYDFQPVMWSDMFFRMQFDGVYNVSKGELSQEVLDKIPEEVALCYWNYYTPPAKTATLEHMFSQHAKMKRSIWFAGGSWSWRGPTPKNYFSNLVTPTQLKFARQYGVRNVIATAWGDDGGECTVWNVLPSLLQYGELNYGEADQKTLDDRCIDCFGLHYSELMLLDQVGKPDVVDPTRTGPACYEKMALLNDVLLGILDHDLSQTDLPAKYARDAYVLAQVSAGRFDFLFETQQKLAALLAVKTDISVRIKKAYRAGDKEALGAIADRDIPEVCVRLEAFHSALRSQWHRVNKPFGFEVQDIRMGGIRERLTTAQLRLKAYLNGEITSLEELEQPDLPRNPEGNVDNLNNWQKSATACVLSW